MDGSKALIAVTICSNYIKSHETILNSFSWPKSGEEQDVMNQINGFGIALAVGVIFALVRGNSLVCK